MSSETEHMRTGGREGGREQGRDEGRTEGKDRERRRTWCNNGERQRGGEEEWKGWHRKYRAGERREDARHEAGTSSKEEGEMRGEGHGGVGPRADGETVRGEHIVIGERDRGSEERRAERNR